MIEKEQKIHGDLDLAYCMEYEDGEVKTILKWKDIDECINRLTFDNNIMDYLFLLQNKDNEIYGCWFLGLRNGIWSIYRFAKKEYDRGYYAISMELKDSKRCCASLQMNAKHNYHIIKTDKEAFIFDFDKFKKVSDTFNDLIETKAYSLNCPIIFIKKVEDPYLGSHQFYGQIDHDGNIMPKIYNEAFEEIQDTPLMEGNDKVLDIETLKKRIEGYGLVLIAKENRIHNKIIRANKQALNEEKTKKKVR